MSNYSENNDFTDILNRMLARIDDSLDKRQGSIIYDALAPAAAELAQAYIALDVYSKQTYLLNAVGSNLDNRVADYGLARKEATPAYKIIEIYDTLNARLSVPIGTRFSVPNEYGGYVFEIIEEKYAGKYIGKCETAGSVGNSCTGTLLPLTSINNLGQALITSTYIPGEDTETDSELRTRVLNHINQKPFAGNKNYYQEVTNNIEGVGGCKVFSTWNGGGTVKLAIIDANYEIPNDTFVRYVQNIIDPIQYHGEGEGLAPIGHTVTVVPAVELSLAFLIGVRLKTGASQSDVLADLTDRVSAYIRQVQSNWENAPRPNIYEHDEGVIYIYRSKISSIVFGNEWVEDVNSVYINTHDNDLKIDITAENPQFPVFGRLEINEVS